MTEDQPPDEALDARLYAIDLKLAALRAHLRDLDRLDAAGDPRAFAADALAEYVRWIERVIGHAVASQATGPRR